MTFYNPLFPPFFRYHSPHSTNYKKPVEYECNNNSSNNCNTQNKKTDCTNSNPSNCQEKNNCDHENRQKNNCKKPLDIGLFYNYLQETDTLIIIALLYFLYQQDSKDYSLMLCLFLLLFD